MRWMLGSRQALLLFDLVLSSAHSHEGVLWLLRKAVELGFVWATGFVSQHPGDSGDSQFRWSSSRVHMPVCHDPTSNFTEAVAVTVCHVQE